MARRGCHDPVACVTRIMAVVSAGRPRTRETAGTTWLPLAGLLAALLVAAPARVAARGEGGPPQIRVLVVHQLRLDSLLTISMEQTYRRVLSEALGAALDYHSEYFDSFRFWGEEQEDEFRRHLQDRYSARPPDIVIAGTTGALRLVRGDGVDLFPSSPIVYHAGVGTPRPRHSAGVVSRLDLAASVELARRLQSDLERVFVVTGSSDFDRGYERLARAQLGRFDGELAVEYLNDLTLDVVEEKVANLPPRSMVLTLSMSRDAAGRQMLPIEAMDRITLRANVPVYGIHDLQLGRGIVGGHLVDSTIAARRIAEIALTVLSGQPPEDLPITEIDQQVTEADWRQIERWKLAGRALPGGTIVRFREPPVWTQYRGYLAAAMAFGLAQTALIIGLLVQRSRRRRAEAGIRASEADLKTSYARIRDLAGRLLTAQEAERTRIARDLHDDACQEVAGVALDLSTLVARTADQPGASVPRALASIQGRVAAIAESLRVLSHDLHPGVLHHVGLTAALAAHCSEAERQYDVQVTLEIGEGAEPPDSKVALALFRITQEAVRNAARHGNARRIAVSLARVADRVNLTVGDDGCGFDPLQARHGGGLGLVSIEERARLLQGVATIRSRPSGGTEVAVCIPAAWLADVQV